MNLQPEAAGQVPGREYFNAKTLLGSIGENNRNIKILLREKSQKIKKVQYAMDMKARNKTPLNERQQQLFHEFTGIYAKEGGILKQSLMSMKNTLQSGIETQRSIIHNQNTEQILLSLMTLYKHQKKAIHSLRRMIASSERILRML